MSAVERCTFNIAQVHFGVAHYHSYLLCSATEGRLGASDPPPGTKWRDWKEETNESVLTFDARSQSKPSRAAMKVRRRSGRRFTFAVWISPNRQFTTSQIRRAGYRCIGPGNPNGRTRCSVIRLPNDWRASAASRLRRRCLLPRKIRGRLLLGPG